MGLSMQSVIHQPSVIFKDILDCQHEFLKRLAHHILNSEICTKCQGACVPIHGRNAGRNGVKLDSAATIFTFRAPWEKGAPFSANQRADGRLGSQWAAFKTPMDPPWNFK